MNRAALQTRTMRAALGVVAGLVVLAIVAPLVTPYLPDGIDLANRRAAPSWNHLFGTDELGRDVFTRTLFGARVSLAIGLLSAAVVAVLGTAIGAVSGYAGGWLDDVLMRVTDSMLAVPRLPLLMVTAAILEPSVIVLVLLVGFVGWMETASHWPGCTVPIAPFWSRHCPTSRGCCTMKSRRRSRVPTSWSSVTLARSTIAMKIGGPRGRSSCG